MSWHNHARQLLTVPVVVTTHDNNHYYGVLLRIDEPDGGALILTCDASGVRGRTYLPSWRIHSVDHDPNASTHRPA